MSHISSSRQSQTYPSTVTQNPLQLPTPRLPHMMMLGPRDPDTTEAFLRTMAPRRDPSDSSPSVESLSGSPSHAFSGAGVGRPSKSVRKAKRTLRQRRQRERAWKMSRQEKHGKLMEKVWDIINELTTQIDFRKTKSHAESDPATRYEGYLQSMHAWERHLKGATSTDSSRFEPIYRGSEELHSELDTWSDDTPGRAELLSHFQDVLTLAKILARRPPSRKSLTCVNSSLAAPVPDGSGRTATKPTDTEDEQCVQGCNSTVTDQGRTAPSGSNTLLVPRPTGLIASQFILWSPKSYRLSSPRKVQGLSDLA